jgi:hypothetical protein
MKYTYLSRPNAALAILGLLFSLSACRQSPETSLQMTLEVKPSGRPGVYLVSGTANVPDRSKISVAGFRYLQPMNEPAQLDPTTSNYAILARETVEVAQGKWQTNLNLWQIAPDGRYQENWQINQTKLQTSLTPSQKVIFLTVFEPKNQLPEIQQALGKLTQKVDNTLIRFTSNGQPYFQTSQALSVSLPTGQTVPPVATTVEANDGWGNRFTLEPERSSALNNRVLSIPKETETTPLSPSEFLR